MAKKEKPESWLAVYFRNYEQFTEDCDTSQEACNFLEVGFKDNYLAPLSVVAPDGTEYLWPGRGGHEPTWKYLAKEHY